MADDDQDRNGLPPGWRPEWRVPKARGVGSRARARLAAVPDATAARAEPLPSNEQIRDRAIRVLLSLAEDESAQPTARVGAARGLLDLSIPRKLGAPVEADAQTTPEREARYRELTLRAVGQIYGDGAVALLESFEPVSRSDDAIPLASPKAQDEAETDEEESK